MEGQTASTLTVGVPRETAPGERRVAMTPDTVKRLTASGVSVRVESGAVPADADLSPTVRGHAVRICKEALTNVRRHAHADHVVIAIRPDPEGVEIAVIDDGVGPSGDLTTLRSAAGHRGLDGMRDRAQVVGGWCRLERANGHTTLRFWLPRDDASAPAQ